VLLIYFINYKLYFWQKDEAFYSDCKNATQLHALQVLLYLQPLADPNVDRKKQTTLVLSQLMPKTVVFY